MSQSNLHKSEEGWRRFRERTQSGAFARGSMMEHRPNDLIAKAEVVIPKFEGEREKPRRSRRRRVVAHNGRTF